MIEVTALLQELKADRLGRQTDLQKSEERMGRIEEWLVKFTKDQNENLGSQAKSPGIQSTR